MQLHISHSPTGSLIIEIRDKCDNCNHVHLTEREQWDQVIRQTSAWLADNNPVCRRFPGILPWARGRSPAAKLPVVTEGQVDRGGDAAARSAALWAHQGGGDDSKDFTNAVALATAGMGEAQAPPLSTLVIRTAKPIRSVFGCITCKKRKVKCDEKRPKCGNCAKKSARNCVYPYELTLLTPPTAAVPPLPQPVPQSAVSTVPEVPAPPPMVASSSSSSSLLRMKVERSPPPSHTEPTVATAAETVASVSSMGSDPSPLPLSYEAERSLRPTLQALALSTLPGSTGRPGRDLIARCVDQHGMTWFIEASEVVDGEKFSSQRKRTYSERRQAILAYCWDTYTAYQGKIPLALDEVSDGLGNLASAALLYAFVAVGAFHYAYWAKVRRMPSEEHYVGAYALGRLAYDAANRLVHLVKTDKYPDPDIEAKVFLSISLLVTYAAPAADKLAWDGLRLLTHVVRLYDGATSLMRHLEQRPETGACTVEVIGGIVLETAQCLLRGTDTQIIPSDRGSWFDEYPIAQRVVTEGFGYSLYMAKLALETTAVLYGPLSSETISPALKSLYRSLSTTALVTIYSAPQPPRVQTGDLLIRQSLFCLIYLDGFHLRPDDAQVQRASDAILELFSEAVCDGTYTVRWLLPMIVGACVCSAERRQCVIELYELMAGTCGSDDIAVAQRLTEEVWARRDAGREDWSWRHVVKDRKELDIMYI